MRQPTQTPMGTTYDYAPLVRWIESHKCYPANEHPGELRKKALVPNLALRKVITRWLEETREANRRPVRHRVRRAQSPYSARSQAR